MMSALEKRHITPSEYLAIERAAEYKSEYIHGDVLMMAGNTKQHIAIVMNLGSEFRAALRGRDCQAVATEMRVQVEDGRYTYPDIAVTCGDRKYLDDTFDTLLNPCV